MTIYNIIASNYQNVFPLDLRRLEFVISLLDKQAVRILDVGCTTGDLSLVLAVRGHRVTGIDLNRKMIKLARQEIQSHQVNFQTLDIRHLVKLPCAGFYQRVLCFGNTLPHLNSMNEVDDFFSQVAALLADNGIFIFQILNYDKIGRENHINFPLIETADFIFSREYLFPDSGKILFRITWQDMQRGKSLCDQVFLLPLLGAQLSKLLEKNGFSPLNIYADYAKNPGGAGDFSHIYTAVKTTKAA